MRIREKLLDHTFHWGKYGTTCQTRHLKITNCQLLILISRAISYRLQTFKINQWRTGAHAYVVCMLGGGQTDCSVVAKDLSSVLIVHSFTYHNQGIQGITGNDYAGWGSINGAVLVYGCTRLEIHR